MFSWVISNNYIKTEYLLVIGLQVFTEEHTLNFLTCCSRKTLKLVINYFLFKKELDTPVFLCVFCRSVFVIGVFAVQYSSQLFARCLMDGKPFTIFRLASRSIRPTSTNCSSWISVPRRRFVSCSYIVSRSVFLSIKECMHIKNIEAVEEVCRL